MEIRQSQAAFGIVVANRLDRCLAKRLTPEVETARLGQLYIRLPWQRWNWPWPSLAYRQEDRSQARRPI